MKNFKMEDKKTMTEFEKAKAKAILEGNMLKLKLLLANYEDDLMSKVFPVDTMIDMFNKAEKYGRALNWLQQINLQRFTIPEQQAKQAEEAKKTIVSPNGMKIV